VVGEIVFVLEVDVVVEVELVIDSEVVYADVDVVLLEVVFSVVVVLDGDVG